jgi:gamma-glutamyl:cysteine ligase YbdK (ATP-grasp superfamily)
VSDNFLSTFSGFGIEIEYMIVDCTTLDVAPVADRLLTAAEGELTSETEQGATCWSNELVLHVIELKTNGPRTALDSVAPDFQSDIVRINGMLAPWNACLLPGGAHPWMVPSHDTHIWPHDDDAIYAAYDRIFGCQGHGWSNLQSMHINLPFKDDAEFGRLHAAIRTILPLLPALAASTPVLEGRRTGLLDARIDAYAANQKRVPPITGLVIPPAVGSNAEYQTRILQPMYRAIAPHDPESILQYEWLNSHGAIARFDRQTIEIRLLDTQENPGADLAIAALVVAVVKRLYAGLAENLAAADALDTALLAELLRRCVEDGEDARIDAPEYLRVLGVPAVTQTAGTVWRKLARSVQDELQAHQRALDVILGEGTLARRLLRSIGEACDRDALLRTYSKLRDCLAAGRMFHADE